MTKYIGRVTKLGNDLPDGHALREIQVNGPAPILHRKHADSNPDAQASNFPSASPTGSNMSKKKVAFICVHNSCRSQIAEALGKHLASDVFESYSAGTETKPQINQDAVRIMKELYGIDMEKTQYSKLISDIPAPDIAISMGCNVSCPFIGRAFDDNWGLEDPTGSEDQVFVEIIREIEKRILQLKQSLISRCLNESATPVRLEIA